MEIHIHDIPIYLMVKHKQFEAVLRVVYSKGSNINPSLLNVPLASASLR